MKNNPLTTESFSLDKSLLYFHGSLDKNIKKIKAPSWQNPFCVTTDIEYAMDYAKEHQEMFGKTVTSPKEGVVYALTIDDNLKIFDFQKTKDVMLLKGKWPTSILNRFKPSKQFEGNYVDPLSEITEMIMGAEWGDEKEDIKAFKKLSLRIEKEIGEKISLDDLEKDSTLKYKKRFLFRNLLLKDIQELGFDGYRASEGVEAQTDNSFVLININAIDKICPTPLPYKVAEQAVEMLYQRMKSGEVYELDDKDIKKKDDFLKAYIDASKRVDEAWKKYHGEYQMFCDDCKKNVSKMDYDQYIMVTDKLWKYLCNHGGRKLDSEHPDTILCRDCMEKRLGRSLTLKDLKDVPLNDDFKKLLKKNKSAIKEYLEVNESSFNLHNRVLYHGTTLDKKEFQINPPSVDKLFWVTPDLSYAKVFMNEYYGKRFGNIYKIILKDNINLFNPKTKSDLEKISWPNYFKHVLSTTDDLLVACSKVIGAKEQNEMYKDFVVDPKEENRVSEYVKNAKISKDQAQKEVDEWDEFARTQLKISQFKPSKFKGLYKHDNTPAGYIRTKFCEELKKIGYVGVVSKENSKYRTFGIFDVEALDKITAEPIYKD